MKYWAHLGCWISTCYGPFWLGACFEIYEPCISSIFKFSFSGHDEPWVTEKPWISESADMGAQLYFLMMVLQKSQTVRRLCCVLMMS
jgi:hypothetical protein